MAVKRNWVGAVQRTFRVRRSSDSTQKSCSMGIGTNLVEAVRRKFSKSPPHKPIIVFNHTNNSDTFTNEEMEEEEEKEQANEEHIIEYPKEFDAASGDDGDDEGYANASASFSSLEDLSFKEDLAAIIIQAFFRGRLARRAYRALRSLVRLQAVVRGAQVRSQARIALNCMRALVRLQRRIRDRQLLSMSSSELG